MTVTMTVTETQIEETIFKLLKQIAPEADFDALAPDEDVRETLDIDSFDFLNFLIGLHEAFGVEIPETDYGQLITLTGIMHYLLERVG